MKKGQRKGGGKNKKKRANNKSSVNKNGKPELRFKYGDRVDCLLRGEWETGTVIKVCNEHVQGLELFLLDNGEVIKTDQASSNSVRKSESPPIQIEYRVGNRVECKLLRLISGRIIWGEEWLLGTIIETDEDWAENERPPYEIKLDNEEESFYFIGPQNMIRRAPLRFDVGDRVEMKMWWKDEPDLPDEPGTIVKLWPESDSWEADCNVPYTVRLDNGQLVCPKNDTDECIISSESPPVPVENFMKGDRVECKADGRWNQGTVIQSNLDWAKRDCPPFFIRFDDGKYTHIYGSNIRACGNDRLIPISEALEKLGLSDNDSLFKTPPPMPDCPICFLPLPIDYEAYRTQPCCGVTLCYGCLYAHWNTHGVEKTVEGTCPFCRAPEFRPNKDKLRNIRERVELNDAENIYSLGSQYETGSLGLPIDHQKAHELYVRAADLGSPRACVRASVGFGLGKEVKKDEAKIIFYLEKGAKLGQVNARHHLGTVAANKEEWDLALRHWKISASAGYQKSLDNLKDSYKAGMLSKEELTECLRAHQKSVSEEWSEGRAKAAAFNKQIHQFR